MADIHEVLVHCSAAVFSGALSSCLLFRHEAMVLTTHNFFYVFKDLVRLPSRLSSSRRSTAVQWIGQETWYGTTLSGYSRGLETEHRRWSPKSRCRQHFFPPLLSTRPQPWHRELHLHPMAEVPSFWLFTALVENFLPAHSTFEKSWQLRYSTHSPVNAESIPNHAVHFTNFSVCEMVFLAYLVLSLSTRLEQNACSYSHE